MKSASAHVGQGRLRRGTCHGKSNNLGWPQTKGIFWNISTGFNSLAKKTALFNTVNFFISFSFVAIFGVCFSVTWFRDIEKKCFMHELRVHFSSWKRIFKMYYVRKRTTTSSTIELSYLEPSDQWLLLHTIVLSVLKRK